MKASEYKALSSEGWTPEEVWKVIVDNLALIKATANRYIEFSSEGRALKSDLISELREDLVQVGIEALFQKIPKWDASRSKLSTYMVVILRYAFANYATQLLEQKSIVPKNSQPDDVRYAESLDFILDNSNQDYLFHPLTPPPPSGDDFGPVLEGYVHVLTRKQANVVRQRLIGGRTFEQIAEVNGVSEQSVGEMFHMAIKRLRKAVEDDATFEERERAHRQGEHLGDGPQGSEVDAEAETQS